MSDGSSGQLLLPRRPLILGIAGCSGSGKTTLARELRSQFSATLLPLDLYYYDLSGLPVEERAKQNFDHPRALESTLLVRQVEALAAGESIEHPVYDFTTHTRVSGVTERVRPVPVLIVEGILALHFEELRTLFDFSVYVNAPPEVCLARRIARDIRERGRTEASVRKQFEATTRPMAEKYVLPSAAYASIVVEGTDALDWSVEQVVRRMRALRLLP